MCRLRRVCGQSGTESSRSRAKLVGSCTKLDVPGRSPAGKGSEDEAPIQPAAGSARRSEPPEGVLAVVGVEVDVAEPDVEPQVDVGVLLQQLRGTPLDPRPTVTLEADRQFLLGVDEEPYL